MRAKIIKDVRTVVIKVGSSVLTTPGGDVDHHRIRELVNGITKIRSSGRKVVLVSSGAIAVGMNRLGLRNKVEGIPDKQAIAAIGQPHLMALYDAYFQKEGIQISQILLTRDDLNNRRRYLNARDTIDSLFKFGALPVINENDTVVVEEIKVGDNDNLSAMVTNLTESDLLVNLTNIDGLFDKDPRVHRDATLIPVVEKIDRKITRQASAIPGFLGRGGMASKIKAARKVALAGVPTIIANGLKRHILQQIFSGKDVGTLFPAREVSLCSRKHWIVFTKSPKGELIIDRGAERAILERGKSLLPSGIRQVNGRFSMGNSVLLLNEEGREIAVGMVNYHSGDSWKIMGAKTSEIESILGFKHDDEVIHRDNLILNNRMEEGEDLCQLRT